MRVVIFLLVWNTAKSQENNGNAPAGKNRQKRQYKVLGIKNSSTFSLGEDLRPSLCFWGFLCSPQPQSTDHHLPRGPPDPLEASSHPLGCICHVHAILKPVTFLSISIRGHTAGCFVCTIVSIITYQQVCPLPCFLPSCLFLRRQSDLLEMQI